MKDLITKFKKLSRKKKVAIIASTIALVIVVGTFLFLYCNGYSGLHNHSAAKHGQIKVACVGDSVTYGHGISGWARNNYPAQLQKILGDEYHVENFGHSGTTASSKGDKPYVESPQYELSLDYNADIVVIMLGSNDTKPENWTSSLDFILEYGKIVKSYKAKNPNVRIILCTPPMAFYTDGKTSGTTNFDIRPDQVKEVMDRVRLHALTDGCELVDIYDLTKYHPEWFETDGVHPSNDGAKAIAETVADKIKANN